ncbi:hypothetical protein BDY24DRAFT_1322 [Mrakia frigida]|uniref:uncharacterized protein n=1 Tax=Mrakia frigida TaxID=29902 RepID=UPI003FCBEFE8
MLSSQSGGPPSSITSSSSSAPFLPLPPPSSTRPPFSPPSATTMASSSSSSSSTSQGPILLSLPSHLHIEDVYVQSGRPKRAQLEVRNDGPDELKVELGSRGGGEVEFWMEPPTERKDSSKSSNVSLPSSRQSSSSHRTGSPLPPTTQPLKSILLQPFSSSSINFTFVPPPPQSCSPAATEEPAALVTPRAAPVSDLLLATPVAGGVLRGAMQKAPTWWLDGEEGGAGAGAEPPVESVVVLAEKEAASPPSVLDGLDGVHVYGIAGMGGEGSSGDALRSSTSVHGDLVFVASRTSSPPTDPSTLDPDGPQPLEESSPLLEADRSQTFTVPYSASVCESIFLASAVDPSTNTAVSHPLEPSTPFQGSLSHSSQLSLDYGTSLPPRSALSREFIVRNASDIPLLLSCAVVFDSSPWQVWAALEDLDSGEKFPLGGEGTDGRKVVLLPSIASLETRRFTLAVFVGADGAGGDEFFLDVLVCNLNNPSNTLLLQASGSTAVDPSAEQNILQVLSGPSVNFGNIIRGSSIRHLIRIKNTGDEPIEVTLGKEVGWDVKFLFGGVKGDELLNDEALGVPMESSVPRGGGGGDLSSSVGEGGVRRPTVSNGSRDDSDASSHQQINFLGRGAAPSTFVGGSESGTLLHPKPVVAGRVFPPSSSITTTHPTSGAPRTSSPFRSPSNLSSATESNGNGSVDGTSANSSLLDSSLDRSLSRTNSRRSDDPPPPPSPSDKPTTSTSSSFQQSASPTQPTSPPRSSRSSILAPPNPPNISTHESLLRRPWALEPSISNITANQIEELIMRPGTEYRVWLSYTPSQDIPLFVDPGSLVSTSFRVTLDYSPSSSSSTVAASSSSRGALGSRSTKAVYRRRKILPCAASVCSTSIKVTPSVLDFGQVTVGSSKSSSISISNLSDLPAKIELRFISKVLSASRIFITIPPRESTTEKIDFFPRRINPNYTKQLNVRSLLDRSKDQMVEIHAQNVDLDGVTLHSHLYKIYTPSGLNFVDFGSVVLNSPAVRTITVKNVQPSDLLLHFVAAQPEDLSIYAKASELPPPLPSSSTHARLDSGETVVPDPAAEKSVSKAPPVSNRERFLDSMAAREAGGEAEVRFPAVVGRVGGRQRDKSSVRGGAGGGGGAVGEGEVVVPKPINMVNAMKKGSKGRTVALYGNVVIFKDRSLLAGSEYLDLAGPPLCSHRSPTASQRIHLLTTIENEDKSKLSGKFPKIAKTIFGGESKATKAKAATTSTINHSSSASSPLNDTSPPSSSSTSKSKPPSTPKKRIRSTTHQPGEGSESGAVGGVSSSTSTPTSVGQPSSSSSSSTPAATSTLVDEIRSPALTGKRKQRLAEPVDAADVSRLSLDELLSAIEHRDLVQSFKTGSSSSRETEELYVRTTINLKLALQAAIDNGKLVAVTNTDLLIAGDGDRQLVLVMKAKGASRPQVQGDRSRRQDSKVLITLKEFEEGLGERFPGLAVEKEMLPVRELLVRSNMTRSVLDVAQTHINFGNLEKGDSKSKTIIIHNRSESPGLFRIRLSGKISSNDFKLGEGRYGVVEPFGKKEVAGFVFTPSMPGLFSESLIVENVQDGDNDMVVSVKATVRKTYSFWVSPLDIVIPDVDFTKPLHDYSGLFNITNSSKGDRSFVVEVDPPSPDQASPCSLSIQLSDGESKAALTKAEDEELENILQKLKIARRKAKPDKIEKYEARLVELGIPIPPSTDPISEPSTTTTPTAASPPSSTAKETTSATPKSSSPPQTPITTPPPSKIATPPSSTTRIAVPLAAGQSQTLRTGLCALFGPSGPPSSSEGEEEKVLPDLRLTLRIWEKK